MVTLKLGLVGVNVLRPEVRVSRLPVKAAQVLFWEKDVIRKYDYDVMYLQQPFAKVTAGKMSSLWRLSRMCL